MKIIDRAKINNLYVVPGDSLQLRVRDLGGELKTVLESTIDREMTIDEVASFYVEQDDGFGKTGIGGAFLEKKE